VLNWRKLWYALPKDDRHQRLVRLFQSEREQQMTLQHGDFTNFKMNYKVLGIPMCRTAFLMVTGLHVNVLQAARKAALGDGPVGGWLQRRSPKYHDCRAWLLDYSQTHGDTSSLIDQIYLPCGAIELYYSVYFRVRTSQNAGADTIAGLWLFRRTWSQDFPFITRRSPQGLFTHCGLCDFLRMLISITQDQMLKKSLLLRLGSHYDFQAAQRAAMNAVFEESKRCPLEVFAVSWDKMDQAKTILPKLQALSNTALMKSDGRLALSLIGVLAPGVWTKPLVYSVFKDERKEGSNMICSLLIDLLLGFVATMGCLPKKVFIQADNTPKETKNTITIFVACWLLIQLKGTKLRVVEFAYLLVGHTHDLIDQLFAFINKALRGRDVLSPSDMYRTLQANMKNCPAFFHLKDFYDFHIVQPDWLSPKSITGVKGPHNYRIFWSRDDSVCIQSKPFLTSTEWSPPLILLTPEQCAAVSRIWPEPIHPEWAPGQESASRSFVAKLIAVLQSAGKPITGAEELLRITNRQIPEFAPSKETLQQKIKRLRGDSLYARNLPPLLASMEFIDQTTAAVFRGSGHSVVNRVIHVSAGQGDLGYCSLPFMDGDLAIYKNPSWIDMPGAGPCPIRVGKILRVVDEDSSHDPYCVIDSWWPIDKPDKWSNKGPNIFASWIPCQTPLRVRAGPKAKTPKMVPSAKHLMVTRKDLLVWPLELEPDAHHAGSGRIPFAAFRYLRDHTRSIDPGRPEHAFSKRGKRFYMSVVNDFAQRAYNDSRDRQPSDSE
jgi:hypothetical protein